MTRIYRGIGLFIAVTLTFFIIAGCAKKGVQQIEDTSTSPKVAVTPGTTEESKQGMDLTMPKSEGSVGVESQTKQGASVVGEGNTFEQKDISFDYDRFSLTAEARNILAEKASFLNANAEIKIKIEGHCDERGTREYNLALGERRAKAAQDYLIFLGINPGRMSTISYGEEKPSDLGHNEEAWAKNRRAHFVILGN